MSNRRISRRGLQRAALAAAAAALGGCRPVASTPEAANPSAAATPGPTVSPQSEPKLTQSSSRTAAPAPSPPPSATSVARQPYLAGMVRPAEDGHHFAIEGPNEPFVPIGCDYFGPHSGWAPHIWQQYDAEHVTRQLGKIAYAGFTVIRVFLDISTLNPLEGYYSEKGFAKLDSPINIAEQAGLRLILSGPNTWEGTPAHLAGDRYADPRIIGYVNNLWRVLAKRYGHIHYHYDLGPAQ